jgi:2'-5' RNA ligase
MKYLIAHLIRGEAKEAHEAVTKDLAEKFDIYPLHTHIPPHLTLKTPFDLDVKNSEPLYKTLTEFAESHTQSEYRFKGFGQFTEHTIYIDVLPSEEMKLIVRELTQTLEGVPGLVIDAYDTEQKFHASVTRDIFKPFNATEVWKYLQTKNQPDFKMKFDNIAVLTKSGEHWVVDRIWELLN